MPFKWKISLTLGRGAWTPTRLPPPGIDRILVAIFEHTFSVRADEVTRQPIVVVVVVVVVVGAVPVTRPMGRVQALLQTKLLLRLNFPPSFIRTLPPKPELRLHVNTPRMRTPHSVSSGLT